jgi:hypothetical protein
MMVSPVLRRMAEYSREVQRRLAHGAARAAQPERAQRLSL